MTPLEYDYLRRILKERSGLTLAADKQYLVESRLMPVARQHGLRGLSDLVAYVRRPGTEPLMTEVVEAMTTNESYFFRDRMPFEHLRDTVMPALLKARAATRHIRIWSAAAATGQEAYSIAMGLREHGGIPPGWRVEILATDLSSEVIAKGKAGIYSQFEVQRGLPIQLLIKYFNKVGENWQIAPELRAMVHFRPFNLMHDFAELGSFDLVFCRNVLIYFDNETKVRVLERLARVTERDGYLVLGAAETVIGLTDRFKALPDRHGLYVPNLPERAVAGTPLRLVAAG